MWWAEIADAIWMGGAVGRKNLLSRPLSASRERIAGRLIRKFHNLLRLLGFSFGGRRAWWRPGQLWADLSHCEDKPWLEKTHRAPVDCVGVARDNIEGLRVEPMFGLEDPGRQGVFRVVRKDPDRLLEEDGSGVEPSVHEVNGSA